MQTWEQVAAVPSMVKFMSHKLKETTVIYSTQTHAPNQNKIITPRMIPIEDKKMFVKVHSLFLIEF